jgi:REP element-mobilizing transposase RayT
MVSYNAKKGATAVTHSPADPNVLRLHLVQVTKYRRKVLTEKILKYLQKVFAEIRESWRCRMIDVGGEDDHIHRLIERHPPLNIATLINNIKSANSKTVRKTTSLSTSLYFYGSPTSGTQHTLLAVLVM